MELTVYGIETRLCAHHCHNLLFRVATELTVYGIETFHGNYLLEKQVYVATAPTVYGMRRRVWTAEEQSDDEAHTLQVPERSEGKTREIRKWLTVYGMRRRVRGSRGAKRR